MSQQFAPGGGIDTSQRDLPKQPAAHVGRPRCIASGAMATAAPLPSTERHEIELNGVVRYVAAGTTVATLVETVPVGGVAVARNGEVVPRSSWSHTVVQPGDRLEVLRVAPGG
jgi:sulfur carrier protein